MSEKIPRFDKDGLTKQQAAFALEYIKDFNGLHAAIRAGYKRKGAHVTAHRLLNHAKVSAVISRNIEKQRERTKIDADYVLQAHTMIDNMRMSDILDDDLKLKPLSEWPEAWDKYLSAADIAEMYERRDDVKELIGYIKKIKWVDKLKNLELLGRHLEVKAYADVTKVEHGLTEEAAQTIKDVLKRMDGKSTGIRVPQALPEPNDE